MQTEFSSTPAMQLEAGNCVCPSCCTHGMQSFYVARNLPVHSVLLMPDRETALAYPTRDLILGVCPICGFISNVVFDPGVHDYSPNYEETQGFSPTFKAFARSLAERLIQDWELKGKSVLEIGCGKGEFVALLCELGMARGIGIDPAYVPGRLNSTAAARLQFIQDFYSDAHAHLQADLICCRHTLEHIAQTREFLGMLRRNLEDRPSTLVLFEVPDMARILHEGAFWDVYYEHCSYFTAGSLARAFRSAGFEVLDLRLEYGGQYLTLLARPSDSTTSGRAEIEESPAVVVKAAATFSSQFQELQRNWQEKIRALKQAGKRIVLWGSGSKALAFILSLGLGEDIDSVVDINPHKCGKYMPGASQQIVAPESLPGSPPDVVVIMNPIYKEEIRDQLAEMGLQPELLTL